jgi:tRNA (cytidine/uridine-2'-O-)-methyltransferase
MFRIALYQPEIPPNTGNIIRLAANTASQLHLIHPLGFELDDKRLKRAGLDYWEWAQIIHHQDPDDFFNAMKNKRVFACTTKGFVQYSTVNYQADDVFLFGPETRGLPPDILERCQRDQWIRIPMCPNNRSLNLSNACAVIIYEAWRQIGFVGSMNSV